MLIRLLVVLASLLTVCWCQAERRAPQMGFMGVRGKKTSGDFPLSSSSSLISSVRAEDKRAAPMGFQGLRGKKSYDDADLLEDKRAPQMGFMGMRGKKDQDYLWDLEEDKRAAPAGFFGMRGKKGPSGFFGMRGKKGPSGFFGMRGKKGPAGFLGVRGKKDGGSDEEIQSLLQQLIQDSAVHQDMEDILESRLKRSIDTFDEDQEFFIFN